MTTPDPIIRAEVKFRGGTGHRETFEDWAALVAWLQSPAFADHADRVRTLTVVRPNPFKPPEPGHPERYQARPRSLNAVIHRLSTEAA